MPSTIRLRTGQYRKYAALKGWRTDDAAATAIGVNPATLSRVLKGTSAPGERFIGGLLLALPELAFEDLFEVVTDDNEAVPA